MPPRLNKRQQREQEEILALGGEASISENVEGEDDRPIERPAPPKTGFAALTAGDDEEENDESEPEEKQTSAQTSSSKAKKKKKKKKAPAESKKGVPESDTPEPIVPSGNKGKGKAKVVKDEFDEALEELSKKYPEMHISPHPTATTSGSVGGGFARSLVNLRSLLSVSVKHLDAEAELRRFFGSKIIGASKPTSRHQVRSTLTRPAANWPSAALRQGLAMRLLIPTEVARKGSVSQFDGDKMFTIEHSMEYRGIQSQFLQCVGSYDPNTLIALVQVYPWHVDTLMQISEIYRHNEEHTQASDFLARALFSLERSFSGAFNLTNGTSRLDFDRVENRAVFLALHRHVIDLVRRGCPRTSFEFARLLLGLDPCLDPHGALLHLDYLAIKCKMGEWLLDMWHTWGEVRGVMVGPDDESVDIKAIPGWKYSRALALLSQEEEKGEKPTKSLQALQEAMLTFPGMVLPLADKAGISLSPEAYSHKALQVQEGWVATQSGLSTAYFLCQIYAQRSHQLWRAPGPTALFLAALTPQLIADLLKPNGMRNAAKAHWSSTALNLSVARHALVADLRPLSAFYVPRASTPAANLAYDPLPPRTNVGGYDADYFNGVTIKNRRRGAAPRARGVGDAARQLLGILQGVVGEQGERERVRDWIRGDLAMGGGDGPQDAAEQAARDGILQWIRDHPALRDEFPDAIAILDQAGRPRGEDSDDDFDSDDEEFERELEERVEREMGQPAARRGAGRGVGAELVPPIDLGDDGIDRGIPGFGRAVPFIPREGEVDSEEDSDEEDDEDDSDDDAPEGTAAVIPRLMQGFMNMFWGGGRQAEATDAVAEEAPQAVGSDTQRDGRRPEPDDPD